jgi:mannosyl-3-phosphoglycerate phosphatase
MSDSSDMNLLIFSDLDGTLLDHGDYSHAAAGAGLEAVRRRRIPLIFTTSKTRPEIERLQAELRIREPFIPENGAAVFFPEGYRGFKIARGQRQSGYTVIRLGEPYEEIRRFAAAMAARFNLKTFGDMSVAEIALHTGLSSEQAALAKRREFTEPFLAEPETDVGELTRIAASQGLKVTAGGRFFHLIGARQDKGVAVRRCVEVFDRNTGGGIVTVGLGDSENDVPMLASVDIPVLLPRADGAYQDCDVPGLLRAGHPGSRGWNEAVLNVLDNRAGRRRKDE